MRAEELRKIYEEAQKNNANRFWDEFKDTLFEGLRKQAESRCDSINIGHGDKLAENKTGGNWVNYKPLRDKVTQELEKLGYKVSYVDDRQGEYISIAW